MDAETLEAIVSLPACLLVFSIIFILVFKKDISSLIGRITEASKTGIKAAPQNIEAQKAEAQKAEVPKEPVEKFLVAMGSSVVLQDIENNIKKDLESKSLDTDGNIRLLTNHLAATQLLLEFEQIYVRIFGSQIYLLKKLNESATRGQPKEFVEKHFEYVKNNLFPKDLANWSSEDYLHILINRSLVTVDKDNFYITNLGVEFLAWIARDGRTESKEL